MASLIYSPSHTPADPQNFSNLQRDMSDQKPRIRVVQQGARLKKVKTMEADATITKEEIAIFAHQNIPELNSKFSSEINVFAVLLKVQRLELHEAIGIYTKNSNREVSEMGVGESLAQLKVDASNAHIYVFVCLVEEWSSLYFGNNLWSNQEARVLDKICYQKPAKFVDGTRAEWSFYRSEELVSDLKRPLSLHLDNFSCRYSENIPLYFFNSGSGTGKSRNTDEFKGTLLVAAQGYRDVKRIEDAFVFRVSFENDNRFPLQYTNAQRNPKSLKFEDNIDHGFNVRLLQQLQPGNLSIGEIYNQFGSIPSTKSIMKALAEKEGVEFPQYSAIIVVDGIHNVPGDAHSPSHLCFLLESLHDLARSSFFCIGLCTATTHAPRRRLMGYSTQKCVELSLPRLPPPTILLNGIQTPVFDRNNRIIRLMLEDCGGHGRAMFALSDVLKRYCPHYPRTLDLDSDDVDTLTQQFHSAIIATYKIDLQLWTGASFLAVLDWIIGRELVRLEDEIPDLSGVTVDDICGRGLLRFIPHSHPIGMLALRNGERRYIEAVFVWVWILSSHFRSMIADSDSHVAKKCIEMLKTANYKSFLDISADTEGRATFSDWN